MKQPSVYLKMRVLGAVDTVEGRTRDQRIKNVATMTFHDEEGNPRQFTWRTVQTWFYRYKNHGITGMTNETRKDKGQTRKVTPEELLEAVNSARPHFRDDKRMSKIALYRFCIENGLLQRGRIAQTTFYRFLREYGLLATSDKDDHKKRLAFSMKYANQLWQADTMFGPYLNSGTAGSCASHDGLKTGELIARCETQDSGTAGSCASHDGLKTGESIPRCEEKVTGASPAGPAKKQAKLIAFIDDASRVLCHGEFFFVENVDTMVRAIRAAFYKRGVPEQLLVDNGSIYCSQEITLICARIGCLLRHTAVRDAAAKGKIERFFRRVRDQFLVRKLDLSSLEALNRQFTDWIENDYNATLHDGIGMKPIDRFGIDLSRIRFLSPSEHNDELFYAEATRKVKKDNTFSFSGRRYETPVDLHDKEIQLRYDRHNTDAVFVYFKGQRMGVARLLDAVANGLLRRFETPTPSRKEQP